MATIIQASGAKAVDPGFGFTLILHDDTTNGPINKPVKVAVTLTGPHGNPYTSTVIVDNPVSDNVVKIFVPFGDKNYTPGTTLQYTIEVFVPADADSASATFKGAVYAESGTMNLQSTLPLSVPYNGSLSMNQMINSVNDNHVGIMQADGNFCVYKKSADGETSVACTDSSNSPVGAGGPFTLRVVSMAMPKKSYTRLYIYNANNTQISASNPYFPSGYAMSLFIKNGVICLGYDANSAQQVQMSPQWINT